MRPTKRQRRSYRDSTRKEQHKETTEGAVTPKPTEPASTDAEYAEFLEIMRGIGATVTDPTETSDTTTTTPAPTTQPRPRNPWANKVKRIASTWGSAVHGQMHFAPTTSKDYHGVWGTRKLSTVREWVSLARDSIFQDDNFVVASKPGENGGHNFLVDMDGQTVGYVSGSKVQPGTQPEAKHLAVYVNKKGYISTAFPCTPEIF